jgi:hypothetical protein
MSQFSELRTTVRRPLCIDDLLHLLQGCPALEQLAGPRIA